jgi:hypothetical protein
LHPDFVHRGEQNRGTLVVVKKQILSGALFCVLLLVVSCAPGAGFAASRFPLKLGESWQMQAFKPGNSESQTFAIDLYDEPELDEDGDWGVAIEAGKFEGEMYHLTQDNVLLAFIQLTRGSDPELVLCAFAEASVGKTRFVGTSFFGKSSELSQLSNLPRDRFARCELSKK